MSANLPAVIRADAARVVCAVADSGQSLDDVLPAYGYVGSARGLHRALCYGTLRWHAQLTAILTPLLDRPISRLDPQLRALLLVGLYQLVHEAAAPHAAVSETVEAARALGQARAAGFVNAILRRAQRDGPALLASVGNDPAVRTAHPRWLVQRLAQDWPDQYLQILDADNAHPPLWLRVNALRSTSERSTALLEGAGFTVTPHPLAPHALRVAPAADVHALPGFAEGELSVQDVAAQLAVGLLDARPGMRVLDACAAPGGKTCHLQEQAEAALTLHALDVSESRLARVRENLDRLGLAAVLMTGDAERPGDWSDGAAYDRILLDVPCSSTGVIRRHPDIKLLRRPSDIASLAKRQRRLLDALWPLLKPGGRLLYTSCSVLKAENAGIIAPFLATNPDAAECTGERTAHWPASPAAGEPGYPLLPGHTDADGFYYACLDKRES